MVRSRLPAEEGGAADAGSVREQAAELGKFYREVYNLSVSKDAASASSETNSKLERGRTALLAEQMLLGRLIGSKGVYTVKPDDSLSGIAYSMYGSSNLWPKIFETNSHILTSPDQLVPGLPIVIP